MLSQSNFDKAKVDAASALTAVCAYHPFRTLASNSQKGLPLTMKSMTPQALYAGFIPAVGLSHQLFAISFIYEQCKTKNEDVAASLQAGAVSAVSTSYFEGKVIRKQSAIKLSAEKNGLAVTCRGVTPTAFRQMGVGMGMFVFPGWFERKFIEHTGAECKENPSKRAYAFAGGVAAALITQYPDTVRVVMQSDPDIKLKEACQVAFGQMRSRNAVVSWCLRVVVLGVASTIMSWGRENYPKYLTKEEKDS